MQHTPQPRLKRPVGERLARAAYNSVYGGGGEMTGPTVAGCSAGASKLTLSFDVALLRGSKVLVQRNTSAQPTMLQVLYNASLFCVEPLLMHRNVSCPPNTKNPGKPNPACRGNSWSLISYYSCPLAGETVTTAMRETHTKLLVAHVASSGHPPACPYEDAWQDVVPVVGVAPGTIEISVSVGVAGVRYAMSGGNCCPETPAIGSGQPCSAQTCPLMSSPGRLPANPFQARVVGGKCKCVAPQKCDL